MEQISAEAIAEAQGIPLVSDTDLHGEETEETSTEETEETSTEETEETSTEETEETSTEETSTEETSTEETPEEPQGAESSGEGDTATEDTPPSSDTKPPKGFVPLNALHEVRGENKYLKARIAELQENLQGTPPPGRKEEAPVDDFKVLTDEEFQDLAEDNPAEAIVYSKQFWEYQGRQQAIEDAKLAEQEIEQQISVMAAEAADKMEEIAPGIFDESSEVQQQLVEFAEGLGFTEDMFYLTNPMTKVILPGQDEPLLLGTQAASILATLVKAKNQLSSVDEKAIEQRIRKEVEAELLKKFKGSVTENFKSINDVPKVDGAPKFDKAAVLSEADLTKLSDKEVAEYLGGV